MSQRSKTRGNHSKSVPYTQPNLRGYQKNDNCDSRLSNSQPSSSRKMKSFNSVLREKKTSFCSEKGSRNQYVILLPSILSTDFVPVKQPFLFGLDIESSRIKLPFTDFFDVKKNNFVFEIGEHKLHGQILAIADSSTNLQQSFKKNCNTNPDWKNLKKLVGNVYFSMKLKQKPLDDGEITSQHVLDKITIERIVSSAQKNVTTIEKIPPKIDSSVSDDNIDEIIMIENDSEDCNTPDRLVPKKSIDKKNNSNGQGKDKEKDLSTEKYSPPINSRKNDNSQLKTLTKMVEELENKTCNLSDNDILSSILKNAIRVIQVLVSVVTERELERTEIYFTVPETDETFVQRKKNRIFVEGKLKLPLDMYEAALLKAKTKDPGAVAYQMIHTAFPKPYYHNVILGKKSYEPCELDKFQDQEKPFEKYPLIYVLGFADPLDEPFQGSFDQVRGQQRVQALIDHIFRKVGIQQYDESKESKVRTRLVKELWRKNNPKSKEKDEASAKKKDIHVDQNTEEERDKFSGADSSETENEEFESSKHSNSKENHKNANSNNCLYDEESTDEFWKNIVFE